MKLEQGQIWKQGEDYYRIVEWARLAIKYKLMKDPTTKVGTVHDVTKKEFCRLIKGAQLLGPNDLAPKSEERFDGEDEDKEDLDLNPPAPEEE